MGGERHRGFIPICKPSWCGLIARWSVYTSVENSREISWKFLLHLRLMQWLDSQISSLYCGVDGAFMGLDEIENMGYEECDYSVEKLKNNTVFMQAPS